MSIMYNFSALLLVGFITLNPIYAVAENATFGPQPFKQDEIVRGRFSEEKELAGMTAPFLASGHFTAAPQRGLIWDMEQPLPTASIITPTAAAQDIGGMAVKLPVKNLEHLYAMIYAALGGDWSALEQDYVLTRQAGKPWHVKLAPRSDRKNLGYAAIQVSGNRFVEQIDLVKQDGRHDRFRFSDMTSSPSPLNTRETHLFAEVK